MGLGHDGQENLLAGEPQRRAASRLRGHAAAPLHASSSRAGSEPHPDAWPIESGTPSCSGGGTRIPRLRGRTPTSSRSVFVEARHLVAVGEKPLAPALMVS